MLQKGRTALEIYEQILQDAPQTLDTAMISFKLLSQDIEALVVPFHQPKTIQYLDETSSLTTIEQIQDIVRGIDLITKKHHAEQDKVDAQTALPRRQS